MKKSYSALLLSTLLLSGCGVYKDYHQTASVSEDVYGDAQVRTDSNLAMTSWRQMFADPQLQALIASALERNADVRTALLRIEQAEINYRTSKLAYLPTVAFSPTGNVSKVGSAKEVWDYSLGGSATWQLDIFGASITNNRRKSKANLAYTKDLEQAAKCRLVSSVAQLYFQLQGLDKQLLIQKQMLDLYQTTYESVQTLYEVGIYTSPAVHQTKAGVNALKANILDLQNAIEDLEHSLCMLLDEPKHTIARGSIDAMSMPKQVGIGVPADLLQYRPDVRAAERNMQIAYYDLQLAKGALYPNITLQANATWNENWLIQGIGSLVQPIFQSGKLIGGVKAAKIEQQVALINFRKAVIDAGHEVTTALGHCQLAWDKESLLKEEVESYSQAVDATQELMNNGSTSYLEVITALQDLLKAQLAEVENKSYGAQSLIQLYASLGGGAL